MSKTSAQELYDMYKYGGIYPLKVIYELFGYNNWTNEMKEDDDNSFMIFDGIYKGLQIMDMTEKEINKYYEENKLDEMIHKYYKKRSSGYYKIFCEKNIKIGKTKK
jgi:hypothetical protein